MKEYDCISQNTESTVMAEFEGGYYSSAQYQSESEMEADFIKRLERQAYEYLPINSEKELISNLRSQLEILNNIRFTDNEWEAFFKKYLGNPNEGVVEKSRTIQEDHKKVLTRDDGTFVNVYLIDKENIHNNSLQVINQYVPEGGSHENRYDVTILVNGLPLVHIELKRRGVDIREAFNQIRRYNRESFWSGSGLFEFVQIFVISNGTLTKYYSNTTRDSHVKQQNRGSKKQTSNSFEFTSYWARLDNEPIRDLVDFTQTFLSKHTLLNVLTKYCVFTSENLLLVMRPYQIAATERIIQRIRTSSNLKTWGKREGGGFIWHTTGSGKTLTSFKTARLASSMEEIDKVLFVVDRKDLDYQTMKEYDRFEKGAANSNTSTAVLTRQLNDPNCRIIITTIQKLSNFVVKNATHPIYTEHVVMIFDECHRSQFGDMHRAIVKKFKKYHIFGFTGTPIFPDNAGATRDIEFTTTEGTFGEKLHSYTIVDAIRDGNVLPFRVDYIRTLRPEDEIKQESVPAIDEAKILMDPRRISYISQYILEHFAQKTKRNEQHYDFNKLQNISSVAKAKKDVEEVKVKTKLQGFNSIFAVASIPFVKLYYTELMRQMEELPENKRLKIATIYSYAPNEAEEDFGIDENSENTDGLDQSSRDFLEKCISDYNSMFGTSYDTSSEKFQNYYKDVSLRMKNREIDLLIVVNMFLTGFDATTLNTLWVDKNLRMHGLIQAYSRTNRILNSIKNFGNIICFRNLEPATNAALELFGDKEAGGLVLIKTFDEYYNGYKNEDGTETIGYKPLVEGVIEDFPLEKGIVGEKAEKDFIRRWGTILRYRNILQSFDQFKGKEILSDDQYKDYQGLYLDLYEKYRRNVKGEAVNVNDDIVFEIELVKSVEINIDYILFLVSQKNGDSVHDANLEVKIKKSIGATPDLRDKEDLIMQFVQNTSAGSNINDEWAVYVRQKLGKELQELIATENLRPEETVEFLQQSFRDGEIRESGTGIAGILPPMPLFGAGGSREAKKRTVTDKLKALFKRFYDLCGGGFPFLGVNPPATEESGEENLNKQDEKEQPGSSFPNYLNEINVCD